MLVKVLPELFLKFDLYFFKDPLTGVYNRGLLNKLMQYEDEAKKSFSNYERILVAFIDLNNFKEINDTKGHLEGDRVLFRFAQVFRKNIRESDLFIRFGGDEFICIFTGIGKKTVKRILSKVQDELKKSYKNEITFSAGIANSPTDGESILDLIKVADARLYKAKNYGLQFVDDDAPLPLLLPSLQLVGKTAEISSLKRLFSSRGSFPKFLFIQGESGVGKTFLLQNLLKKINNSVVYWSSLEEIKSSFPFQAISGLLEYKIKREGVEQLNSLPSHIKVQINRIFPFFQIGDNGFSESSSINFYGIAMAISSILFHTMRKIIIVIDNAQWIDPESIDVIKILSRLISHKKIYFVLISSTPTPQCLIDFRSYLSKKYEVFTHTVQPLTYNETQQLITTSFRKFPDKRLVDFVYRITSGIPLFIEEILLNLYKNGMVDMDGAKVTLKSKEIHLSFKIKHILEKQISNLNATQKRILEIIALSGISEPAILSSILSLPTNEVKKAIEKLVWDEKILKLSNGRAVVRNFLVVEFIKESLPEDRLRMIYKKIGDYLKGAGESVFKIARYYYLASDPDGINYCYNAGIECEKIGLYETGKQFMEWAMVLAKTYGTKKNFFRDIFVKYVRFIFKTGNAKEAESMLKKLLNEAVEEGNENLIAEVHLNLYPIYEFMGNLEKAKKHLESALDIYKKTDNYEGLASCYLNFGSFYIETTKPEMALKNLKSAYRIYTKIQSKIGCLKAMMNIAIVKELLGRKSLAMKYYRQALDIAEEIKNMEMMVLIYNNLGDLKSKMMEFDDAKMLFEKARELARKSNMPHLEVTVLTNIAILFLNTGEYSRAIKEFKTLLNSVYLTDNSVLKARSHYNLSIAYWGLGRYIKAVDHINISIKVYREINHARGVALSNILLGEMLVTLGKYDEAEECFNEANEMLSRIASPRVRIFHELNLAEMYIYRGHVGRARSILKRNNIERYGETEYILKNRYYLLLAWINLERNALKRVYNYIQILRRSRNNTLEEIEILLLEGRYWLKLQEIKKAKRHFLDAMSLSKQTEDIFCKAKAIFWNAYFLKKTNMQRVATSMYHQALSILSRTNAKGMIEYFQSMWKS